MITQDKEWTKCMEFTATATGRVTVMSSTLLPGDQITIRFASFKDLKILIDIPEVSEGLINWPQWPKTWLLI